MTWDGRTWGGLIWAVRLVPVPGHRMGVNQHKQNVKKKKTKENQPLAKLAQRIRTKWNIPVSRLETATRGYILEEAVNEDGRAILCNTNVNP